MALAHWRDSVGRRTAAVSTEPALNSGPRVRRVTLSLLNWEWTPPAARRPAHIRPIALGPDD